MSSFSERLRELRIKNKITQQDLADKLGVSKAIISAYEVGKRVPPISGLEVIADYFNVDLDYLLGKSNIENRYLFHKINEKIMNIIDSNNITIEEFAISIDTDINFIYKWLKGTLYPNWDDIKKISSIYNVPFEYLAGNSYKNFGHMYDFDDDIYIKENSSVYSRPVVGYVQAGIPITAIENIIDYEELDPREYKNLGEYFGLKIKGDSMSPRILNGDVVIVHQQASVESGNIAIVLVNGEEATCKKVLYKENGIILNSFNPNYEPMYFTEEEIHNLPVTIVGKVVELRGKFQ